jgi:hypothetical protein
LQLDGTLVVGGARVLLAGDTTVRALDFLGDSRDFTPPTRTPTLIVDGTLTVTERMGDGKPLLGGYRPGQIEGRGQITILPDARLAPSGQTFRGVTIRCQGEFYSDVGLQLGRDAVLEVEGTWTGFADGSGTQDYGGIFPGTPTMEPGDPLDWGVVNLRVPVVFHGGAPIIEVPFHSDETIRLETVVIWGAALSFSAGGSFRKPIQIDAGSSLRLLRPRDLRDTDPRYYDNIYTVESTSGIEGPGRVELFGSDLILNAPMNVGEFIFQDSYRFDVGFLPWSEVSGTGDITVSQTLYWIGGRILGPRTVRVGPAAQASVFGDPFYYANPRAILDGITLINEGTCALSGAVFTGGALFHNEGTCEIGRAVAEAGGGTFENRGSTTTDSAGDIQVPFLNAGVLRIAGNFYFDDRITFASLDNAGLLVVGPQYNLLHFIVTGDFVQQATGTFRSEIVNFVNPDTTGSPPLIVNGRATLAGTLEVDYIPSVIQAPRPGDVWTILTFGTLSGDFTQLIDLDPTDGIGFDGRFNGSTMQVVARQE